ncbi:MAG: thioesterase family protein [Crenarchaeota archaeon]|nr:thioesterase family protein [Thermoproteota archaeon]
MDVPMLPIGSELSRKYIVTSEHTAKFLGSGDVEVLSTPSMIAFMENTAREISQMYLPENLTTVGIKVDVRHLNPAPKGAEITVSAKLIQQDRRKLVFEVKAFWKDELIGEGLHERFIVDRDKFLSKIKDKLSR